jgi:hypothetical protein
VAVGHWLLLFIFAKFVLPLSLFLISPFKPSPCMLCGEHRSMLAHVPCVASSLVVLPDNSS